MKYIFSSNGNMEGQGNGFLTTGLLGANYGHR